MTRLLTPCELAGTVRAIPSKSQAHRLLICAALSARPSALELSERSADIDATMDCLRAMGAAIRSDGARILVQPVSRPPAEPVLLRCRESGSTLRFLLPVAGALGLTGSFLREGRLPQRPLGPLAEALQSHGMTLREEGASLCFSGQLEPGRYALPGNLSSQFLSGLLFALPLLSGESTLTVTTELESAAYLALTEHALKESGIRMEKTENVYRIPGGQTYSPPIEAKAEGDWSNAAFFLCAGAVAGPVTVTNLNLSSMQGDRAVLDLLRQFGANVQAADDRAAVSPAPLRGIRIDAREIPDLVPVLAAVAAAAEGETVIENAGRLRLKESDRLAAVRQLLESLGGSVRELPDGLVIRGGALLSGGAADACGDHRIAMTAAVLSCLCRAAVVLTGAEAVQKSYPGFFEDWDSLRKERST